MPLERHSAVVGPVVVVEPLVVVGAAAAVELLVFAVAEVLENRLLVLRSLLVRLTLVRAQGFE